MLFYVIYIKMVRDLYQYFQTGMIDLNQSSFS